MVVFLTASVASPLVAHVIIRLKKNHLDKAIVTIVTKEFGHPELPILTNLDFGHTDPQWIIPLGVKAEIDCINKRFHLIERACI